MKSLNIIDLDKTLIETDSFGEFILRHFNVEISLWILLRLFRIISREKFAEKVIMASVKVLNDDEKICEFINFLRKKINGDILKMIGDYSGENSIILVLSASPQEYVKKFADSLGFDGLGSHWRGGKFFHCYGENKIKLLKENYPPSEYEYNFAISDNDDDINLLNLFKIAFLVKNKKYIPLKKIN